MLIFTRCIHGFMSNLIKKSWTDSTVYVCATTHLTILHLTFKCTYVPLRWSLMSHSTPIEILTNLLMEFLKFNQIFVKSFQITVSWLTMFALKVGSKLKIVKLCKRSIQNSMNGVKIKLLYWHLNFDIIDHSGGTVFQDQIVQQRQLFCYFVSLEVSKMHMIF